MNIISPHKKLEIMRQAEKNPGVAIMNMFEMLRTEMKAILEEKISMIEKEVIAKSAIEAVNYLKGVKGKDGVTPVKGEDYYTEKEKREFLKLITPKKGVDYLTENELVAVRDFIVSKISFPKDGRTPTEKELLNLIKPLIPKVKSGSTPIKGVDYPTFEQLQSFTKNYINDLKLKDGSPDKPIEIANKLNTLKEKVDMAVIKGLDNTLRIMSNSIRDRKGGGGKSGGGMGNAVAQTFSLLSSTTSLTLSNKVASGGKAIWVNYQGQQQAYGTHFTVSGKVVTLLFTPVDGTFADIIFIRT